MTGEYLVCCRGGMVEHELHAVQLDVEKERQNKKNKLFMCEFCLWVKMQGKRVSQ